MTRAAIYARVSTSEQSPQMQLDALREYAERRGFAVVDEFVDHGVSGTKASRPMLDRLMEAADWRRSVWVFIGGGWRPMPAAVVVSMQARLVWSMLGRGMWLYQKGTAQRGLNGHGWVKKQPKGR